MCRTPAHQAAAESLEARVAAFLQGGGAVTRYDNLNQVVGVATEDLPVAVPEAVPGLSEEFKAAHCGDFGRLLEELEPELAAEELPPLDSDTAVFGCAPAAPVLPVEEHPPAPVERPAVDVLVELRAIRAEALSCLRRLDECVGRFGR